METIVFLAFLSAQGWLKFIDVLIFCSLGMFTADTMWFFIGKIKHLNTLKKIPRVEKNYKEASRVIDKITNKSIFGLMTILKFVYGLAIPIIMYMGRKRKITYWKFALYSLIIIIPWTLGLSALGWFAGLGFSWALEVYDSLKIAGIIALIFFIVLHLSIIKINKYLRKKKII